MQSREGKCRIAAAVRPAVEVNFDRGQLCGFSLRGKERGEMAEKEAGDASAVPFTYDVRTEGGGDWLKSRRYY